MRPGVMLFGLLLAGVLGGGYIYLDNQKRERDEEFLRSLGALRVLEAELIRSLPEAERTRIVPDAALVPEPQPGEWKTRGHVDIMETDGATWQAPFDAVVRAVCTSFAKAECWEVVTLSLAEAAVVDGRAAKKPIDRAAPVGASSPALSASSVEIPSPSSTQTAARDRPQETGKTRAGQAAPPLQVSSAWLEWLRGGEWRIVPGGGRRDAGQALSPPAIPQPVPEPPGAPGSAKKTTLHASDDAVGEGAPRLSRAAANESGGEQSRAGPERERSDAPPPAPVTSDPSLRQELAGDTRQAPRYPAPPASAPLPRNREEVVATTSRAEAANAPKEPSESASLGDAPDPPPRPAVTASLDEGPEQKTGAVDAPQDVPAETRFAASPGVTRTGGQTPAPSAAREDAMPVVPEEVRRDPPDALASAAGPAGERTAREHRPSAEEAAVERPPPASGAVETVDAVPRSKPPPPTAQAPAGANAPVAAARAEPTAPRSRERTLGDVIADIFASRPSDSASPPASANRASRALRPGRAPTDATAPSLSASRPIPKLPPLPESGIDAPRADGRTALIGAVEEGQLATIRTLLLHGANPDRVSADGATPLMYAAWRVDTDAVRLLLETGADPNIANVDGKTALMAAAAAGAPEIVDLLLARGARANAQALGGWTALMYAAWRDHAAIVDLLLKHGARPDLRNDEGMTAADLAQERGRGATSLGSLN